jgi:alpha-L-fucosidase 2
MTLPDKRNIIAPLLEAPAEIHHDIEYAHPAGIRLALDAYIPHGAGPFPAVLVIHGGAFTFGDRRFVVAPLRTALSNADTAWFSIDYRLSPQHEPADALADIEAALNFVAQHEAEFKIDRTRLFLMGESAGAYLILMSACRLGKERIAGVISIGGPVQLWTLAPKVQEHVLTIFRTKENEALHTLSPITQVHEHMPRVLFLHGTEDDHVPIIQVQEMCAAIHAVGGDCEIQAIEGGGHSANQWVLMPECGGFPAKLTSWLHRACQ